MGAAVFFNSCSSDDNETTEKKLLLSKVTTTYYDDPAHPKTSVETSEYNSQGQLIKNVFKDGISIIEYNNDKPTKINNYNNKQELVYYSRFFYTGSQLNKVESIYPTSTSNRTLTYSYNTNGQLISTSLCQSTDCSSPGITTYAYSGDNVSVETTTYGKGIVINLKDEYVYNNKLSPYTNTNKYLRLFMGRTITLSKNNYTETLSLIKNNDSWVGGEKTSYTYEYNNSGLPVKAVGIGSDGNLSVQYDYEYISQ